jgi:hypothetical protein
LIGYSLSKAKLLIGEECNYTIVETITPFEDKRLERQGRDPVIVRQIKDNDTVCFTVSYFK